MVSLRFLFSNKFYQNRSLSCGIHVWLGIQVNQGKLNMGQGMETDITYTVIYSSYFNSKIVEKNDLLSKCFVWSIEITNYLYGSFKKIRIRYQSQQIHSPKLLKIARNSSKLMLTKCVNLISFLNLQAQKCSFP